MLTMRAVIPPQKDLIRFTNLSRQPSLQSSDHQHQEALQEQHGKLENRTAHTTTLGKVNINCGIFQGDSSSLLLFIITLMPVLQNAETVLQVISRETDSHRWTDRQKSHSTQRQVCADCVINKVLNQPFSAYG